MINATFTLDGRECRVRLDERSGRVTGAVLAMWDWEAGVIRRGPLTDSDREALLGAAERALSVALARHMEARGQLRLNLEGNAE